MATTGEELPCMTMFGAVRGAEVIELIERTTGEPCPCKRRGACLLLPPGVEQTPGA